MIEHGYVTVPAGRVHQAAELIHDSARDFVSRYRSWVEPYLTDDIDGGSAAGRAEGATR
jgi:hypothetical protein